MAFDSKLRKRIAWLNTDGGFENQISYASIAEAAWGLDEKRVMQILRYLEENWDKVWDPTKWVVSSLRKAKDAIGGLEPGFEQQLRRQVRYLNTGGGFDSAITYSKIADAAVGLDSAQVMEILRLLEQRWQHVEDPTAWVCSGLRKVAAVSGSKAGASWDGDGWADAGWTSAEWGDGWAGAAADHDTPEERDPDRSPLPTTRWRRRPGPSSHWSEGSGEDVRQRPGGAWPGRLGKHPAGQRGIAPAPEAKQRQQRLQDDGADATAGADAEEAVACWRDLLRNGGKQRAGHKVRSVTAGGTQQEARPHAGPGLPRSGEETPRPGAGKRGKISLEESLAFRAPHPPPPPPHPPGGGREATESLALFADRCSQEMCPVQCEELSVCTDVTGGFPSTPATSTSTCVPVASGRSPSETSLASSHRPLEHLLPGCVLPEGCGASAYAIYRSGDASPGGGPDGGSRGPNGGHDNESEACAELTGEGAAEANLEGIKLVSSWMPAARTFIDFPGPPSPDVTTAERRSRSI